MAARQELVIGFWLLAIGFKKIKFIPLRKANG
jgi:hypothetical protein